MMNVTGVPLTISLIMAREAGLKDPAVDLAIERSARLLRFYIGKGSIPYGDHHPWTQNHDDNGKNGMAGVMFNLLGEKNGAEYFSRMSVAAHGAERDCGHCGNFTNMLWAIPGVALLGPGSHRRLDERIRSAVLRPDAHLGFPFPPSRRSRTERRQLPRLGCHGRLSARPRHAAEKAVCSPAKQPNIAPQIDMRPPPTP